MHLDDTQAARRAGAREPLFPSPLRAGVSLAVAARSDPETLQSAALAMVTEEVADRGWRATARSIGPGLVSGAADVDPTTVATLAVVGAGTTYSLAWLVLLLFPMIAVVQVVSTHLGAVSGRDLQTAVVETYGPFWRWLLMGSILIVTVITIGADLEGGAAAIGVLIGINWRWFVLPLSLILFTVLVIGGYHHLQRALRYVLLCLVGYAAAVVLAQPNWSAILRGSLVPSFHVNSTYVADVLSLLGTTLTSYVYVWQTIAQVEEHDPRVSLRARKVDGALGGLSAVGLFWFILIATGATLGVHHLHANTAGQAAQALRPVAGGVAGSLFALGLLASAIVALPVLMATTAYVTGAQMQWRRGLTLKLSEAPLFYAALASAAVFGAGIALSGLSPIRLLFLAGIAGGVGTPVGLVLLVAAAGNRVLMRGRPIGRWWRVGGWLTCAVVSAADVLFVVWALGGRISS